MDAFLAQTFNVSINTIRALKGNSTDEEFLAHLIHTKRAPDGISWFIFNKKRTFLLAEQKRLPYRAWAERNNLAKVFAEMTELETIATLSHNPFYLLYAFDVPLEVCTSLLQEIGIGVSPEMYAHACVWKHLCEHRSIYIDEAREMFQIRVDIDIEKLEIFPRSMIDTHPLRDSDPYKESSSAMKDRLADPFAIVSAIRERKFLENRIYVSGGMYRICDRAKQFVDAIRGVYERAGKLETGVRKAYKRLKE